MILSFGVPRMPYTEKNQQDFDFSDFRFNQIYIKSLMNFDWDFKSFL